MAPSYNLSIVFVMLALCPVIHCIQQINFTYQSQSNNLGQFITMFTLCFAPLATHVAFGLPKIVVLAQKGPRWIDKVTSFNPISITWRYYAIVYGRVQVKHWTPADMAFYNARFWNGQSWDGSKEMMVQCHNYLTSAPPLPHATLFSASAVATIAIALQGVQALYAIITGIFPANVPGISAAFGAGLPALFVPLGLLGLIRLPAARWISDDFAYYYKEELSPPLQYTSITTETDREYHGSNVELRLRNQPLRHSSLATDPDEDRRSTAEQSLRGIRDWRCICYRIWWICTIVTLMGFAISDVFISLVLGKSISLSFFLFLLMYLQLTVEMLVIHLIYLSKTTHLSTVIPCSQSTWYKFLTFLLMATAVAALVVNSLETIQTPDGWYITGVFSNCTTSCMPVNKTIILEQAEAQWLSFLELHGGA